MSFYVRVRWLVVVVEGSLQRQPCKHAKNSNNYYESKKIVLGNQALTLLLSFKSSIELEL